MNGTARPERVQAGLVALVFVVVFAVVSWANPGADHLVEVAAITVPPPAVAGNSTFVHFELHNNGDRRQRLAVTQPVPPELHSGPPQAVAPTGASYEVEPGQVRRASLLWSARRPGWVEVVLDLWVAGTEESAVWRHAGRFFADTYVFAASTPQVSVATAHGSVAGLFGYEFTEQLRAAGVRIGFLSTAISEIALAGVSVLVVHEPAGEGSRGFYSGETAALRQFVQQGGALLVAADPAAPQGDELNRLLAEVGALVRLTSELAAGEEGLAAKVAASQWPGGLGRVFIPGPVRAVAAETGTMLLAVADGQARPGTCVAALEPVGRGWVVVLGAPPFAAGAQTAGYDTVPFFTALFGWLQQRVAPLPN